VVSTIVGLCCGHSTNWRFDLLHDQVDRAATQGRRLESSLRHALLLAAQRSDGSKHKSPVRAIGDPDSKPEVDLRPVPLVSLCEDLGLFPSSSMICRRPAAESGSEGAAATSTASPASRSAWTCDIHPMTISGSTLLSSTARYRPAPVATLWSDLVWARPDVEVRARTTGRLEECHSAAEELRWESRNRDRGPKGPRAGEVEHRIDPVARATHVAIGCDCRFGEWVPPPARIRGAASLLPPGDWRAL